MVYKITKNFPKEEIYGLVLQMRRSAVSIPSNIAEGYRRQYTGEYLQFLWITLGSLAELETQTLLAKDLGYIDNNTYTELFKLFEEINKMLFSLIKSLKKTK